MSNEQTEAPNVESNTTGLRVDLKDKNPSVSIIGGSPSKIPGDLDSPGIESVTRG